MKNKSKEKLDQKKILYDAHTYDVHQFNLMYRMGANNLKSQPKNIQELAEAASLLGKFNNFKTLSYLKESNELMKKVSKHKDHLVQVHNRSKKALEDVDPKVNSYLVNNQYKVRRYPRSVAKNKNMQFKISSPYFSEMTLEKPTKERIIPSSSLKHLSNKKRKAMTLSAKRTLKEKKPERSSLIMLQHSLNAKKIKEEAVASKERKGFKRMKAVSRRGAIGSSIEDQFKQLKMDSLVINNAEEQNEMNEEENITKIKRFNSIMTKDYGLKQVVGRAIKLSKKDSSSPFKSFLDKTKVKRKDTAITYFDLNVDNLNNDKAFPHTPAINEYDLKGKRTIENKKIIKNHLENLEMTKFEIGRYLGRVLNEFN